MGAFDILFGIPQARAQLAASLGQGPGQPGNAAGPQPLAGPPAAPQGPPGGGAGAGPPTGAAPGGAPAGPPQGPPAAPPQPQAYQSPPDLVNMYMQFAQRQQASDQFSRGLGLLAASTYPGRHPEMIMNAMSGGQQDPGAMFNSILQLQQYSQSQARYQDMLANPDKYATAINMNPDKFKTLVSAAGPAGAGDIIGKIIETQAGVGGAGAMQELNAARADWKAQNPGKGDADMLAAHPEYGSMEQYIGYKTEEGKQRLIAGDDKINATASYSQIKPTLDFAESNIEWLNDPAHRDAVATAINTPQAFTTGPGGNLIAKSGFTNIDDTVLQARTKINQLKLELYADRFAHTKNLRSNTEANNLGNSATLLDNQTNDLPTITGELNRLQNDTYAAQGNLAAAAGRQVPAKYADFVDKQTFLDPKSRLYNGATLEQPPADQGKGGAQSSQGGQAQGGGGQLKPLDADAKAKAQDLIKRDGRDAVIAHLKANGYDTSGL